MSVTVSNINAGDFRAQVLAATDIVQLISQTVNLKRRGKDFVGLCPFHQEKSPSFTVSPSKQFFHCYGCKAGGTSIDFVMKRDRVEFLDALRTLAEKAGIEMPKFGVTKEAASQRQRLLEAQSAAAAFFEKMLSTSDEGAKAKEYLQKRGFTDESIKRFRIGVALDRWDGLVNAIGAKFGGELLVAAGLAKPRNQGGGFYDTFRNRLMFPIRDEAGRVIAFGGRVMPRSDDPAKYLNSPETPLFSKSRCVFGLDLARPRIVETRTVAVVEGYTDVQMAHQYGVANVVSVLGTAMTEQHVAILRRFADRIVLLFDADTAGDAAVDRAVELFLTQPVEISIATMPEGTDPDEYLLQHGAKGFEELLAGAKDALVYKWTQLSRKVENAGDITARQAAVEQYLGGLAKARGSGPVDSLRWGAALARVSRLTEIPVDQLQRRFRITGGRDQGSAQKPADVPVSKVVDTANEKAEKWVLGALLLEPGLWQDVQQVINVDDFRDERRRALAERIWDHQRHEGEPVFSEFLSGLDDPTLTSLAVELLDETERHLQVSDSAPSSADVAPDARRFMMDGAAHLLECRQRTEQQKLVADLRSRMEEPQTTDAAAADEIELLRSLQERARRPDLRRA